MRKRYYIIVVIAIINVIILSREFLLSRSLCLCLSVCLFCGATFHVAILREMYRYYCTSVVSVVSFYCVASDLTARSSAGWIFVGNIPDRRGRKLKLIILSRQIGFPSGSTLGLALNARRLHLVSSRVQV